LILRRFSHHIKEQNWFAVGLDVIVVIVGIFLGMQVTEWNDERKTEARSQEYTKRLLADLLVEYKYVTSLEEYFSTAYKSGTKAFKGLTDSNNMNNQEILINAFRATQSNWYERHRATFDELVSAGDLRLIADIDLRNTAARFYSNSTETYKIVSDSLSFTEYRNLFDETINPEIRAKLNELCGDKVDKSNINNKNVIFTIDYECELDVDTVLIDEAIKALKENPNLKTALRRQTARYHTNLINMSLLLDKSGIGELFNSSN